MVSVLVVDDHAAVLQALTDLLSFSAELTVVGAAMNARDAIALLEKEANVDVAVLDISMVGRGGLSLASEIHTRWPALRMLRLSMHPAAEYVPLARQAGAHGYMNKEDAPDELEGAILALAAGQTYFPEWSAIDSTSAAEKTRFRP